MSKQVFLLIIASAITVSLSSCYSQDKSVESKNKQKTESVTCAGVLKGGKLQKVKCEEKP